MHPFADVFDAATVVALAEPQVHARGEGYRRNGRVGPLTVCDGRLEATVRGTMPYVVELWAERGEPRWSCTCPAAEDGSFCKHCTAVALSMGSDDSPLVVPPLAPLARLVRAQASASGRRVDPAPAEDLASFVEEFAQDRLARIVLDHAATDWRLRERLLAEARAARGDGPDMGAWRRRIDNAFAPYGDFVTYREAHGWADGVKDVIDALADLCDAGQHDAAARLAEHAHRRADKAIDHVDDSDGRLSDISLRLSEVHHRACVEGRPDPVELAARLVDLELTSELDGFYRAAAEYAEVLGEAGLAAYRERLEPQWKRIGHGAGDWSDNAFAVRQAMAGWAIGTGDPDALIEVHGRDRILPGNALEIALALDAAGRSDEAMAWARRGIAEHGDTQWHAGDLREFLAGALRGRGEAQAAVELFWQAFVSHPSLATYRRLLDEAAEPRQRRRRPRAARQPRRLAAALRARAAQPPLPARWPSSRRPGGEQRGGSAGRRGARGNPCLRGSRRGGMERSDRARVRRTHVDGARPGTREDPSLGRDGCLRAPGTGADQPEEDPRLPVRGRSDGAHPPPGRRSERAGPLQVAARAGAHRAQGQAQPQETARRQRLVKLRAPAVESLTAECMEVLDGHGRPRLGGCTYDGRSHLWLKRPPTI